MITKKSKKLSIFVCVTTVISSVARNLSLGRFLLGSLVEMTHKKEPYWIMIEHFLSTRLFSTNTDQKKSQPHGQQSDYYTAEDIGQCKERFTAPE